jgi:acetoin utilization deacetylase AcuC-like enzyme
VLSRQRDLYLNEASFEAALLAAGSAVSVSRQIVSGEFVPL